MGIQAFDFSGNLAEFRIRNYDLPFILGGTNGGVSGSLDFANTVFYRYTFGSGLSGKSDVGFGAAICVVMFVIMMIVTFVQNKVLAKFEFDN